MKRILEISIVAIMLLAANFSIDVSAQTIAPPTPSPVSVLSGQVPLPVTVTSSRVALPSTAASAIAVTVYNKGGNDAYVAFGNSSIVATTGGTCVAGVAGPSCLVVAGTAITFYNTATNIAAITSTGTTTLIVYQGTGPFNLSAAGSGSFSLSGSLPAGAANIGTVGGLEFNVSVIPTVQNAAYAAGQSLGGLQTISVGSTNGLTGILSQIQVASKGGSTVAVVAYAWQKNPAATTCTDKTNFVVSQADNQQLIASPQLLSLATAVSAQDASTYGAASGLAANFANGSANTNIYVCLLASAAVTPATTTDYRINIQGIKDAP